MKHLPRLWHVTMGHVEIAQLRAENDRLRNALKKIADGNGIYGIQAGEYKDIARAALASHDKRKEGR